MTSKKLAWNSDGIWVSQGVNSELKGDSFYTYGIGGINGKVYDWLAYVTPDGWVVEIENTQYYGATFNLASVVAAAIKKVN